MESIRLNPIFRDELVQHLEDYLSNLCYERNRGIESISPVAHAKFNNEMDVRIQSLIGDIELLKDLG
jgi:hypothetical protein